MQGRVTQPFNKDMAHNGKIEEFQRERSSERPRQLTHRESHLGQIPRAKKKPVENNLSSERALLCVLWVKRASLCKGAPPPAGTLQNAFFFFCQGSANFLLPPSQGREPLLHRAGRATGLGSRSGSSSGTGTKLLSKYRTQL